MTRSLKYALALLLCCSLWADDEVAVVGPPCYRPTRTDNVPACELVNATDEYLTGYLQALVDMNYYEFEVKVVVREKVAYVYNLPHNQLIAQSILSFVYDVPCICRVQCVPFEPCSNGCVPPPCCNNYSPCCEMSGIWFPQTTVLFAPLVADPRQVTSSAALRFNDNAVGQHVGAVSFGDDYIVYRWKDVWWWHGDLETGIEAGVFAVFDLDHVKACHVNTDFFVSVLFNYAFDVYSFRFRLWHLSSHIGDEFLLSNLDFDRRNLSDEGIDLFASYQLCQPLRLYAGLGYIFDRDKEFPEKPIYVEFGTEVRVFGERYHPDKLYMQPFLAMHFRTWNEHNWSIDQTYALGLEWSKIQGIGRKARLFLEYHDGFSKDGQFLRHRSSYAAIRLMYGF